MSFWEQHFNLRKKEEEKNNTLVFELSVSYLSTSIHSAPGLHHPRTACDYLHPSEMIKTQVSKSNVTVCCSYTGALCTRFCDGASAWRIKRFKKVLFIKASLIQKNNYNKKSSPDITLSRQWCCHSLTPKLSFFPPWAEISRRPPEWRRMLEVCSRDSAPPPGWDDRYGELPAVCFSQSPPCTSISDWTLHIHPRYGVAVGGGGASCPRQLLKHQYVPWTHHFHWLSHNLW